MKGNTSNGFEGQAAAEDGDYNEYDRIVPEAVDRAVCKWQAKKEAELDKIKINTPERGEFYHAAEQLKPTDVAWACEFMSYLKQEVRSIESFADVLKNSVPRIIEVPIRPLRPRSSGETT
jgi:hypothetical protein